MSEFKGFVKKINVKTGSGKRGPWSAYSCKLEKEDGTEYPEWLSLGFEAPKFKEGDYVKMEAAKDDKNYMKVAPDSIKVAKNPPARAGGKRDEGVQVGGSSHGNYSGDFNRQTNPEDAKRMSYANARSAALELTKLLADLEGLPMSAGKGAAHTAKRNAEVIAVVDKLTVKFYNDGMTLRLLETVADTEVDTKADGALPPKEGEEGAAEETTAEEDDDQF